MTIDAFKTVVNINSDKVKQDTVYLPRYNHTCEYCVAYSLYEDKYKGKTGDSHFLKSLVTKEVLMHRAKEICIDCPKIEAIMFNGNAKI